MGGGHYRERTRAFVEHYGTRQMGAIDDTVVAEWLAGGKRNALSLRCGRCSTTPHRRRAAG
jgi:hypothetical protein